MFDEKLLDGYEHEDPHDMSKTREVFGAEQARNEADSGTVLLMTETYACCCYLKSIIELEHLSQILLHGHNTEMQESKLSWYGYLEAAQICECQNSVLEIKELFI
jgi:hypothetical protein